MSDATCDLYDRFEEAIRVARPVFGDFGGRRQFSGTVVTVKCFEDNSWIKELLATPGQGKVLVVDGGGSDRHALLGDMIGESAVRNGWAGVVIDGYVRDQAALATLDIGIKARGTIPRKSVRRGEGQTGLTITLAGITVADGDHLFADEDGIVVLTADQAREVQAQGAD